MVIIRLNCCSTAKVLMKLVGYDIDLFEKLDFSIHAILICSPNLATK